MKKFTMLLLIFTLMLCGCQNTSPSNITLPTTLPTTTAVPSEPVVGPADQSEILPEDMFAVALPATEDTVTTEAGNVIFTQTGQALQLMMPDPDVADKITIDFGTKQDKYNEAAESVRQIAMQENGTGSKSNYFYHALYDHVRIDQNVLSLAGTVAYSSGGIHPDYNCIYANYSMVTGDYLTLGSILTHADRADDLCQLLINAVAQVKEEYGIWDEYESFIRSRFAGDISNDESWFFSSEGLCFSFSPYEIAPYASRVFSVTIPYEKLTDVIEGEYFPVERDNASGAVQGALLNDSNANLFSQISEIVMDENGSMVLLSTDKAIYDISIEVGRWDYGVFDSSYVALSRSALTPGDAIMLQAQLPETDSPVRIIFRSGEQMQCCYISLKGDQVILTPEAE